MHTHLYPHMQSQPMHEMYTCAPTPIHTPCGRHRPCMHGHMKMDLQIHGQQKRYVCMSCLWWCVPQPVTQSLFNKRFVLLVGSSDGQSAYFYLCLVAVVVICVYTHCLLSLPLSLPLSLATVTATVTAAIIGHCHCHCHWPLSLPLSLLLSLATVTATVTATIIGHCHCHCLQ